MVEKTYTMEHIRKPEWLKIQIGANARYADTKRIVDTHKLHTICSSGRCPNLGECWGKGTATFMIGGAICTRSCKFCNTQSGKPLPLDPEEPRHVAESIIKKMNPNTTLETLIPDFQGRTELIRLITETRPDIISHNMETVRRITPLVRSAATYERSLQVIQVIAESGITPKSGIMVGLGETPEEVEQVMDDLLAHGCKILTIGQYLQPSRKHYPVAAYITPEQFQKYKETGEKKGFSTVESGPLVRSSYHAEKHLIYK